MSLRDLNYMGQRTSTQYLVLTFDNVALWHQENSYTCTLTRDIYACLCMATDCVIHACYMCVTCMPYVCYMYVALNLMMT